MQVVVGALDGKNYFYRSKKNSNILKFIYSCDCCAHEVRVETPAGELMGYVKQK